jgi:hypothetical protein
VSDTVNASCSGSLAFGFEGSELHLLAPVLLEPLAEALAGSADPRLAAWRNVLTWLRAAHVTPA